MLRPYFTTAAINQRMRKILVPPKLIFDNVRTIRGRGGHGGDPFKSMGTAKEAQYFKKREKELLTNLKDEMKDQISFHEKQIELHKAVIEKLKQKQRDMEEN